LGEWQNLLGFITIYVLFLSLDVFIHSLWRPIGAFLLKEGRRGEVCRDGAQLSGSEIQTRRSLVGINEPPDQQALRFR
jgi:hypothetical protein